jgi:hypothetical protein
MEATENAAVALIVVVCVVYSAWRLTSARFHLRLIDLLGKHDGWLARLRNRELSKLGGSCGSCASNVKLKVHGPGPSRTPDAPRR